jgi:hypothetical protein
LSVSVCNSRRRSESIRSLRTQEERPLSLAFDYNRPPLKLNSNKYKKFVNHVVRERRGQINPHTFIKKVGGKKRPGCNKYEHGQKYLLFNIQV